MTTVKKPMDILICEFCNKNYTRKNRQQHRRSNLCKAYQKAVKVIQETILTTELNTKMKFKDRVAEPYTDQNGDTIYLTKKNIKFDKKLLH